MTRVTQKPAKSDSQLTAAEREAQKIVEKQMPGWRVVHTPTQNAAPAAKADAVAPPLWYMQAKLGKPIPKSVKDGVYEVGERQVAVKNHKLVRNGTVDFGKGPVEVADGFVVTIKNGMTPEGAIVSGGKVIGHRG